MPNTTCHTCDGTYWWRWEEAFDKFGFNDGDAIVMTETVVEALQNAGYEVTVDRYGLHNTIITAITRNGVAEYPIGIIPGAGDVRPYLSPELITVLDQIFPEDGDINDNESNDQ